MPISGTEVINIARNYPWLAQLKLYASLDRNELHYNPSLEFICIENGRSFTLTSNFTENKALEFSLWYKRPKVVMNFWGSSGSNKKMTVDDIWSIKFDDAIKYLKFFVSGNYQLIENLYE